MEKTNTPHDAAYKQLFSDPEMVASLLRDLIPEKFVEELDFSTLELFPTDHISEGLQERREDIVWRVGWKEGRWCYIALLLEFQSRPDTWMALRLLVYAGLFLQTLVKSGKVAADEPLPPVFPVVIYNGEGEWKAAREVSELFAPMPRSLRRYCPHFRYFLLDEARTKAKELKGKSVQEMGLAELLVYLEHAAGVEEARDVVSELAHRLHGPRYVHLQRVFTVWIMRVGRKLELLDQSREWQDLWEVKTMLEERVESWKERYIQQGVKQGRGLGRKEGRQEGLQEGQRYGLEQAIRNILEARFGAVPPAVFQVLSGISDAEVLRKLTRTASTVPSLQEFVALLAGQED